MLIILDGYGLNANIEGNAVKAASTPFIDSLFEKYPSCRLKTNGKDVGLPVGVMGNSEVGHLNIGAGRIVYQLNTLIDHKIETGEFFQNPALLSAIEHARKYNSKVHLFGLLSDGGVHSSLNHIDGLLEMFHRENFKEVYFHAFMDGRDTLPHSGVNFMKEYCQKAEKYGLGKVASVSGRYYAMDRDNRWERVQKAYEMLVGNSEFGVRSSEFRTPNSEFRILHGGECYTDPVKVIEDSYAKGITDEFILPTQIWQITNHKSNDELQVTSYKLQEAPSKTQDCFGGNSSKEPRNDDGGQFNVEGAERAPILIEDNDAIIFFNFRSDRPRELTKCFIYEDFKEFPVKRFKNLKYITMTEYDINFNPFVEVAFRAEKLDNILGKVIQDNHLTQLRLAETEKYAHVTFFFNGGVEQPFEGEDRILIPSPKIASYDLQPEMSAYGVTEAALKALNEKSYDLIIINFANCDMVGHTGVFDAVVKAVETVDKCVSQVIPLAQEKGYHVILTADHGNAEQMLDDDGNIMTAHSMNEVALILMQNVECGIGNAEFGVEVETPLTFMGGAGGGLQNGKLGDIAPTILKLMGLVVPKEMSGKQLIMERN